MMKSVEATIEPDGQVRLQEPMHLTRRHRAIVTILDMPDVDETALLAEAALAADWLRPEEDEAWSHLNPEA